MAIEQLQIDGVPQPVSRIGLGTWAIGGWMWGGADDNQSVRTIQHAVDEGITLVDTAAVYGFGRSEEVVGRALQGERRDRAVIATKVGLEWTEDGRVFRNSTAARIKKEVEDSLERLRTDRIDIYQVHWPDLATSIEETAKAMANLRQEGKILAIGLSNFSTEQMEQWHSFSPLQAVQPPYNLFERQIEADILPYARQRGLAVLAYGALCRGLLSGRITQEQKFTGDDLRNDDPKFQEPRRSQYLQAVTRLKALAEEKYGRSVLALAIRWILDQDERMIALWGARDPGQLQPVQEVMGWRLRPEDYIAIDRILAEEVKDPVGPEFMAPPVKTV
jgi:aryl-alcohol dehydrogenase-like predicted oxidoreductase